MFRFIKQVFITLINLYLAWLISLISQTEYFLSNQSCMTRPIPISILMNTSKDCVTIHLWLI